MELDMNSPKTLLEDLEWISNWGDLDHDICRIAQEAIDEIAFQARIIKSLVEERDELKAKVEELSDHLDQYNGEDGPL